MTNTPERVRDEWLALRCQHGEADGFAELVRTFERPLLYFVAKLVRDEHLAFDVLQEVWLAAFRGVRRLDQPATLRTWLYRLARGRAVDRVRQDRSRRE